MIGVLLLSESGFKILGLTKILCKCREEIGKKTEFESMGWGEGKKIFSAITFSAKTI